MGRWLNRLKNSNPPDTYPTKPTKPPEMEQKVGFVGFVGCPPGGFEKTQPPTANAWRAVRDAYHDHHHACPVCIAAGKGYGLRCGTGASLWAAYSANDWPGYRD